MRNPTFNGVLEAFPLLRTWHLRGEDLGELDAGGFTGYHVGPPHRVELEHNGRPYAVVRVALVPFVGGVRPLFLCPRCGARRGVLALAPEGAGCRGRGCLKLTYRSTRQTTHERRELRREYLDGLLLDDAGELRRPRGMRVKTFHALADELCALEL